MNVQASEKIMAPLYNRYVPPKSSASVTQTSSAPRPPEVIEQLKKRKRSGEEEAERKAKKENKKRQKLSTQPLGTAKAPVIVAEPSAVVADVPVAPINADVADGEADGGKRESAKKRHKREKEERQRKKEEVKLAKAAGQDVAGHVAEVGEEIVNNASIIEDEQNAAETAPHLSEQMEDDKPVKNPKKQRKVSALGQVERQPTSKLEQHQLHAESDRDGLESRESAPMKQVKKQEAVVKSDANEDVSESKHLSGAHVHPAREKFVSPLESLPARGDELEADSNLKPKKRRHRLESVLREKSSVSATPDAAEEDDELQRKHSNVLSKFAKSTRIANTANAEPQGAPADADADGGAEEPPVLHDLVPLPQAERGPTPEYRPEFSALPNWLANPTIVASEERRSLHELGLPNQTISNLETLGIKEALAVQTALLPLLLPPGSKGSSLLLGTELSVPDICVSAPTGSGKTLAYCLPIVQALNQRDVMHAARALIVVPTRELVQQVSEVATRLATGTSVTVGMISGTANFDKEKAELIKKGRRYDPRGYKTLMAEVHRKDYPPSEDDEGFEAYLEDLHSSDPREQQRLQDAVECIVDHVPTYESKVDVLVCTPGRLIEHLSSTLGFHLRDLEWLVVDEADKLMDQSYDQFLATLNEQISKPGNTEEQSARERYLRGKVLWRDEEERRVRKVVLSATMTRDVGKLAALKLRHPEMIVVKGASEQRSQDGDGNRLVKDGQDSFDLPPFLNEHAVPVGDAAEKPLCLLQLLRQRIFPSFDRIDKGSGEHSDSSSDTTSDDSSDVSDDTSLSDGDSSDDATSETRSIAEDVDEMIVDDEPRSQLPVPGVPNQKSLPETSLDDQHAVPTILIFTSSTEAAHRLTHLLKKLHAPYAPFLTTMTRKASRPDNRINNEASKPVICVSTDRAARGLDTLAGRDITAVIQYDIPRSLTSYVHRVGRTARAGRAGEAWTLYTSPEARWFLKSVAQAENIQRSSSVEKVKIVSEDSELQTRYEDVLGEMKDMVFGNEPSNRAEATGHVKIG